MRNPPTTQTKAATKPLTKAAQARLQGLSKNVRALAGRLEHKELTVIEFLRIVILGLAEPIREKHDVQLGIANEALVYLRRRGDKDREWLISLFEQHANLVYMRKTSGRLQRFHAPQPNPAAVPSIDEPALVSELERRLGTDFGPDRKGRSSPLFDKSIKRQTMQASKFAK